MNAYDDEDHIVVYTTMYGIAAFRIPTPHLTWQIDAYIFKNRPGLKMTRCMKAKHIKVERLETCH